MSPDDEPYLSNHHTNRLIWGAITPSSMDNRTTNAMLMLVVLLSAGCLETVDEIIEDNDDINFFGNSRKNRKI